MPESVLHVPAREVPVPASISDEAQAVVATRLPAAPPERPDLHDSDAWHRQIDEHTANMLAMIGSRADALPFRTRTLDLGEFCVHVVTPDGVSEESGPAVLEIHGGGFINLGGELCRILATSAAMIFGTSVWAVDYRQPPDHPYPAPLDDCLAAYRDLLKVRSPGEILVLGGSAGGNLAAALALRARDEGVPSPAGVILRTPLVDLTDSGDSLQTNRGLDNVLFAAEPVLNLLYAGGNDIRHPYVSPLFGDFTQGFPPTLLTTGTRDLFLSNTVRMHRALRNAGIEAELHVMEAAGHGGFFGAAPEDREIEAEMRAFARRHWEATD
jgi:monoterpene epsilon-lactone hydrolase